MNRGFNKFKESILCAGNPVESKYRKDGGSSYSIHSRGQSFGVGVFRTHSLPIILISMVAILLLILPACAKADFNQSASSGTDSSINQSAYLNGFNEGYKLGVLVILAQNNATIAEEYNVLVQQHNDLLNKTLSEEDAESNKLAKVPMPSSALSKKPSDPWDL